MFIINILYRSLARRLIVSKNDQWEEAAITQAHEFSVTILSVKEFTPRIVTQQSPNTIKCIQNKHLCVAIKALRGFRVKIKCKLYGQGLGVDTREGWPNFSLNSSLHSRSTNLNCCENHSMPWDSERGFDRLAIP